MDKYLVFDMDGTIADFYGVKDWKHYLDDLQDATPYRIAKPIYTPAVLNKLLMNMKKNGYKIIVVSWLSRVATDKTFHQRIIEAKKEWLTKTQFPCDDAIFLNYGENKEDAVKNLSGIKILIDDSDDVLATWSGMKIDAKNNILPVLSSLCEEDKLCA